MPVMEEKELYLVETIQIVKRQYLVRSVDMISAQDTVTMNEVRPYDKCSLDEIIVGSKIIEDVGGLMKVPNVDPIKEGKLERAELDKLMEKNDDE